ncbi:hypothetical protein T440DRAFT_543464 [Plenodomus tracheiphilus IPT5]|uniref:Uncharacterized protein n=1 Tax=Plenodomus tracheiphilus IPT5 TaxID=1408161 RepID=A0A6A7AU92_9PLEO|nr:hypothetical protein T440DRAFT_543464 [Plenodomus tracheiphilus IPT5]
MPGLPTRKGLAISLVQDKDIHLVNIDDSDLTITLISAAAADGVKIVTDIAVSKQVCLQSNYLRAFIDAVKDTDEIILGGELKQSNDTDHGREEGENRDGLLVVLSHLHGLTDERMAELGLHEISVLGVWYAIAYQERDQRDSAKEKLKSWFEQWFAASVTTVELNIDTARALALPCQLFDHAVGFAHVTKWLAYNHIGHVKEFPPKGFKGSKGLNISPGEFVGPVNHARGGLKTSLHKSLYKKCGHLLHYGTDACSCWDATVGQYFRALTKIDVFPVEDVLSYSSVQQIINRLGRFEYTHKTDCIRCRQLDWESVVLKAKANTENYFDGLCLDCMNRSKPKNKSPDDEYCEHNRSVDGRWDKYCRFRHNQSTCYVSWLGRPDVREKILRGPDGYRAEGRE